MTVLHLNPLSTREQCGDLASVERVVQNVVSCFEHVLPAIDAGRLSIIFDWRSEQQSLMPNRQFLSLIAQLSRDTKNQYYLMSRNRSVPASDDRLAVNVSPVGRDELKLSGEVASEYSTANSTWISFGADEICESVALSVRSASDDIEICNAHDLESLILFLPRYEPSEKHRRLPYVDTKGNSVAPMPYDSSEAQRLLLTSVTHGKDRWAYDERSGAFLRFKPTRPEEGIFHGFVIDASEVPSDVKGIIFQA